MDLVIFYKKFLKSNLSLKGTNFFPWRFVEFAHKITGTI